MKQIIDMTGDRYGRLSVTGFGGRVGRYTMWICQCDCGNTVAVSRSCLVSGNTRSCGCLHKEMLIEMSKVRNRTHGETKTRLYNIWQGMKKRCYSDKNKSYKFYGGRGITVCDEWRDSFINFREWAYSNGYNDELTLDRINPNGNYEPSNCRWATWKEQENNRRDNRRISLNGVTHTLAEWCDIYDMNKHEFFRAFGISEKRPDYDEQY